MNSPSHGPGLIDITVTNSSGTSPTSSADHFTYVSPNHCTSASAYPSPPSPQPVNTPIVVTASSAGCPSPLFELWLLIPGGTTWASAGPYSTANTFNVDTRGGKVGTYHFTVWARDRSSAGTYGNNYGRWDQSASFPYVLTKASGVTPCTGVNDSAAPAEPPIQLVGTTVTVTASAVGCPHPLYEFWLLAPGAASYRDVKAYSSSWVLTLDTTNYAPGKYRFSVWVRDASSAGTSGNSSGRWDAFNANLTYTLNPGCTSVSDTAVPANTAAVGTTITITATSTGCPTRPVYEFWIQAPGAGAYTMAQSYANGSPKYTWNTTGLVPGSYRFSVWVLDANSPGAHGNNSGRWDAFNANLVYAVTGCPSVTDSASPPTTARVGTTVTITATPGACPSPQYEFWYLQPGSSVYTPGRSPQVYGTSPWAWNTTGLPKGSYRIAVWIKDAKSGGVSGNSSGRWDAYNSNLLYTLT